jgi:transposase
VGPVRAEGVGIGRQEEGHPVHRARQRYLARVLGEAAVVAGRTDTFLGERYRRIARRRGPNRAAVAVGRSILIIAWHLLADPDTRFNDLGASFYDNHINPDRKKRHYIHELQTLGYRVTLEPAA